MPAQIGILALQGDFEAHRKAIERAGGRALEIRAAADLERVDGLIIPGGESTTMLKLLDAENLLGPVSSFGSRKPIFGTCAGAILLASEVLHPKQPSLGLMDLTVERNAYGRQIDSRIARIELGGQPLEAVFIRAPIIRRVGPGTRILATYGKTPVLVEQGRHMASTFHPELSPESRVHRHFIEKVTAERERDLVPGTLEEVGCPRDCRDNQE
jgi:pyridoxal 5'-phosphate synthase pdxT subunit